MPVHMKALVMTFCPLYTADHGNPDNCLYFPVKFDASGKDKFVEKVADALETVPATVAFEEQVMVPVTERLLIVAEPLR